MIGRLNACVFATKEEADAAGHELMSRWFAVRETRSVEVAKPVNYRFDFEAYKPKAL
jgi:hypothetical protein